MSGVSTQIILETIVKGASAAQREMSNISKSIDNAAASSKKVAAGFAAVALAAGGLGYSMIKAAADAEQTKVAFTTMLGSGEKAQKFMKDLADFASKTPFSLKGLEQSSKQLLAYGSAQEKIIPQLTALGNISAGVGADKLPQLITAFGQVQAATKLTGSEMRQFTEAGVPLIAGLAEHFGVAEKEISKMVSAGKVGFKDVETVLMGMSEEGGKFFNLMQAQSGTLNGLISNLGDEWDQFLRGEGAALLDWGKQFVTFAIHVVQEVLPRWINTIKGLREEFAENKLSIIVLSGVIVGALIPAVLSAAGAFGTLLVTLAPFMLAGVAIAGVVAGIYWIYTNWEAISRKLKDIWGGLKIIFMATWESIRNYAQDSINFIMNLPTMAKDGIVAGFKAIWEAIKNDALAVFDFIMDKLRLLIDALKDPIGTAFPGIKTSIQKAGQSFGNWVGGFGGPKATGGPVKAGKTYWVGENGPEPFTPTMGGYITPNHKAGGGTINININTMVGEAQFVEMLGEKIVKTLTFASAIPVS